MLARILAVMHKEFIHIVRDPRTLGMMFVTPLIQLFLLGYAATTDVRNIPLAVFDQSRSPQSRQLIDAFVTSGQFAVAQEVKSEAELAQLIDRNTVHAGLVIPPTYASDLISGRGGRAAFVLDGADPAISNSALGAARLIGQIAATDVQRQVLARRGSVAMMSPPLEVQTRVWFNPDLASAVFYIPGLLGLIIQMQATMLTATAIVRERERGTIEQLIVTPIQPFELIVGKILPYALVALVITLEVLLVGTFWFQVPMRGSVALLLGISSLFLVSALGIGLLVSTIARTQQEALLATYVTLLPSIFLSGYLFPLAALPPALRAVSGIIPLSYFLVVVRGILVKGVDVSPLISQIIALTIFGSILIALAASRFRKRLD